MIKVAVIGARGRMGATVVKAVNDAADMEVVAQLDQNDQISKDTLANADVAVEFTTPSATKNNVIACLDAGVNVVVGTTGWNEYAIAEVRAHADKAAALIVPNFSLSAVITMAAAKLAARYFASAEVIELHHPKKLDAPSGTASHTAQLIADARNEANCEPMADATETDLLGARGADVSGVHVHSARMTGMVAHQEVIMSNPGEVLTIRTDCFDRISFMEGVLLAVREVRTRQGVLVGLDSVMELV